MESTVIILAGGQSSRMGTNKALLPINGQANIESQVAEARKISNNILLVANNFEDYEYLELPMVKDKRKGVGPLAGLEAGLLASKTEFNLLVACDMPFFNAETGRELLNGLEQYDAVMPHVSGKLHPLFAAYRKSVLPTVDDLLNHNQRRMVSLLDKLNANILHEEDFQSSTHENFTQYFYNMNNPDDYAEAKRISQK